MQMRREPEVFEDGQQSVRYYDSNGLLCRIETLDASEKIRVSVDYGYDQDGNNIERIVRDGGGSVIRRIALNAQGEEIASADDRPVRWKLMDGSDEGLDPRGQEDLGKD
jgi:hypothetical protein